jgi:long-chain acyl-CoA synthetase
MIVTGGENVYSGEVEAVILDHPAVREVAVFGIPDPQG